MGQGGTQPIGLQWRPTPSQLINLVQLRNILWYYIYLVILLLNKDRNLCRLLAGAKFARWHYFVNTCNKNRNKERWWAWRWTIILLLLSWWSESFRANNYTEAISLNIRLYRNIELRARARRIDSGHSGFFIRPPNRLIDWFSDPKSTGNRVLDYCS